MSENGTLTIQCSVIGKDQHEFVFRIQNVLLVCKWRHGGHVGGQEQKPFSPLGNELYFDANLAEKFLLY